MNPLPPVQIRGVGAVTPLGRDLAIIARGLAQQSTAVSTVRRVADDVLNDPSMSKNLRWADRFTRIAAVAAVDAWKSAEMSRSGVAPERVGMIVTSGLGPHCRGFKFLDGMLDSGDAAASPTDFSHSVHGVAAAYISGLLELRGPIVNSTDLELGFEQAVLLAQCWLSEGTCDRVLIGAVEELGEVMLHCVPRILQDRVVPTLGEGAVFLVLDRHSGSAGGFLLDASRALESADLLVVEDSAIAAPATRPPPRSRKTINWTSVFGHSASSAAFSALGAILALGFADPGAPSTIDTAATLRTTSDSRAMLVIERTS